MKYDNTNLKSDEQVTHNWAPLSFEIKNNYNYVLNNSLFKLISNILSLPIFIILYKAFKGKFILHMYPEAAMWPYYVKIKDFKYGAFKKIYKLGELYSKSGVTSPVYLVNKIHARRLYNYIKNGSFNLVVATHLFPSLTLTAIKKHLDKNIKFITNSTDYEPCPFLEETMPDYLIMQKGQENRYIEKGCNKDILVNIRIPVSSRFIFNAKNIRNIYGMVLKKMKM